MNRLLEIPPEQLTAEQKTVLTQANQNKPRRPGAAAPAGGGAAGIGQVLPAQLQERLQLTDEQKKKIADLQKELETKILNVLTDEQRQKVENLKKSRPKERPLDSLIPRWSGCKSKSAA